VDVVVVGGGAAGFFGALRAAELGASVTLLEATATPLQKVRISGGGRCNVTNAATDPALLATKYPRGGKEMRGALARFGPRETMQWFESRGVALKTEPDGRVFPTTDDSETICQCLLREAEKLGVAVRTGAKPTGLTRAERYQVALKDETLLADGVLLASGSNPQGLALAASLGHKLVPPVPSLFTFEVKDARLDGLAGVAVERVRAKALVGSETFEQEGPLLVTHWGLSAHAVLRLSAWGARAFHDAGYRGRLVVDLLPGMSEATLRDRLMAARQREAGRTLGAHPVAPEIPRRLWERLVEAAGGAADMRWSDVPNRGVQALLDQLKRATFEITGKGPFREEFVTAGGVPRGEVDWRAMESRVAPGFHVAGEALDVDALTGGFNLQCAWTTGWIAGTHLGRAP
jgi:predicted Rossmann fold flavoprotein